MPGGLRYLFGELVQGTAYVVFGVKVNNEMRRLPTMKQVSDVSPSFVPSLGSSSDCEPAPYGLKRYESLALAPEAALALNQGTNV